MPAKLPQALRVVNDKLAMGEGLGRNKGQAVRVEIDARGGEVLRIMGYTARRAAQP